MAYHIEFEPVGRRGECPPGETLMDCARQLGVSIVSICGGVGKCQGCKVQVLKGTVSEPTSAETELFSTRQLNESWHLACQTYPKSDCTLYMPPESMTTSQRLQVEGQGISVVLKPAVKAYRVKLPEPTLSDLRSDATRLLDALEKQRRVRSASVDIAVLRDISPNLRLWDWQASVSVREHEIIAVNPPGSRQLGLAVDLGTTKIAGYLVDLKKGDTLAAKGVMNPQVGYGEDIISRIYNAIKSPKASAQLRRLAVSTIQQLAADLCKKAKTKVPEIVDVVIVGNTAMHHLLLGLPVKQMAQPPFLAAIQKALNIKLRDLGLHFAPGAYGHILPNIAGFVGADFVATLLATGALRAKGLTVAMDIGTNTEVALISNGTLTSVSCASGPAFEGGHISHGMRAASGAIERLRISDSAVEYQTIDEAPPVGICGSGIIDAVAQLYLAGVLDEGGRMRREHPRVRVNNNQPEFVLTQEHEERPPITITQHDIREVQLAKAAIRTGIQVLLDTANRSEDEIEQVIIAGAFGTYIDISSAITIGMIPALPLERFHQVGNAAGQGAKQALLSLGKREEAQVIADQVSYIELAAAANFTGTFAQAHYLGKYRIKNGRRERITGEGLGL